MKPEWHRLFIQHPIVFNVLLCVFSWCVLGVDYQSNDDYVIASLLSNAELYADAHVLFVNPLLTSFLQVLEQVSGRFSVWGVFLVLCNLLAGCLLWGIVSRRVCENGIDELKGVILLLLWCVFMVRFYAVIQFTQTAFLMSFAGVVCCLWGQSNVWARYFLGGFLCIIGGMIRFDAALICYLFWLLGLCFVYVQDSTKPECGKQVITFIFALFISVWGGLWGDAAHRQSLGWDVVEWNQARSAISDTTAVRKASDFEAEKYRVYENDLKMIQTFSHADLSVFRQEYLERILKARDGECFFQKLFTRFQKAMSLWSMEKLVELSICWLFIVVCGGLVMVSKNRKWGVGVLGGMLGLLMILASIERLFPRVVYPIVFIACLMLLLMGDRMQISRGLKFGISATFVVLAFIFLMFGLMIEGAWSSPKEGPEQMRGSSELAQFIKSHSDHLFFVQQIDLTIDHFVSPHSPFHDAGISTLPNVLSLGGWHFHLKTQSLKRSQMGCDDIKSLCNDKVLIVCLSSGADRLAYDREYLGMLCKHLELHEGIRPIPELVREVQGIRFYRLSQKNSSAEKFLPRNR